MMKLKEVWNGLWSRFVQCCRKSQQKNQTSEEGAVSQTPVFSPKTENHKESTICSHAACSEIHEDLELFLFSRYQFRYNVLTDQVEFRRRTEKSAQYLLLS